MEVLFAPSIPWATDVSSFEKGSGPDPFAVYRALEGHGISSRVLNPNRRPWNPLYGKDTLLQSIDPLRALNICTRHRDVDVVVSVFEGAATSLATLRAAFGLKAAIALWDLGLTDWRLRNALLNYTLPRIESTYVLGTNQIDYIRNTYAHRRDATFIGHHVDCGFFAPSAGPPTEEFVLSVGDDLGRDFPILLKAMDGVEHPLLLKTRKTLPETPVGAKVIRERISYVDLRSLYLRSTIVVIPTVVTPNASGVSTLLEAAACGRPMVVSDNPGLRDYLVPEENCLVTPPGDATAMNAAIARLLGDPALRKRLGANARTFAKEHCASEVFASRLARELFRTRDLRRSAKAA